MVKLPSMLAMVELDLLTWTLDMGSGWWVRSSTTVDSNRDGVCGSVCALAARNGTQDSSSRKCLMSVGIGFCDYRSASSGSCWTMGVQITFPSVVIPSAETVRWLLKPDYLLLV
jgi:hypothetical protein